MSTVGLNVPMLIKCGHYLVHLFIYALWSIAQSIIWWCDGTSEHLHQVHSGKSYEKSAQLLKIHHKGQPKKVVILQQRHFLTSHQKFVHPEYVLQPHITLCSVNEKEAMFLVPADHVDVTETRRYPFLFDSQFKTADYLVVMPLNSLIRLAKDMDEPTMKIIWLHSPGRCGSTAIGQVFNSLPHGVTLSEPHTTFAVHQMYRRKYLHSTYDWQQDLRYQEIFKAVVRLTVKPTLKPRAEVMLVKNAPMGSILCAPLLHKHFPNIRQIFLYRDAHTQITSLYKVVGCQDVVYQLTQALAYLPGVQVLFPYFLPQSLMVNMCDDPPHRDWLLKDRKVSGFGMMALNWAVACYHYREINQGNATPYVTAFKYEHMKVDKAEFLRAFCQQAGIEVSNTDLHTMLEALEMDSQLNHFTNQDNQGAVKVEITQDMIEEANRFLRKYELPLWGETCDLPFVISKA